MKLLITGGHFSPALALITVLSQKADIAVVGRKTVFEGDSAESLEYSLCKKMGIPFYPIRAGRIPRNVSVHMIPSFSKIPIGFLDARSVLHSFQPDVVVTFGGYLSVPVAYAAYLEKIPVVMHEQTLGAGLANRAVGKIATKICLSFDSSQKYFPKNKTVITGNPIRPEIFKHTKEIHFPDKLPLLYVTGGSTGSHILNMLVHDGLPAILKNANVIHQTGDSQEYRDFDRLTTLRDSLPQDTKKRYVIKKFVEPDEIGSIFYQADLVISRSGINIVTELLALGKPNLLIPLATGQKNEQLSNAEFIKKIGLGTFIRQDVATPELFVQIIEDMLKHLSDYKKYSSEAKKYGMLNAAEHLAAVVESVYEVQKAAKENAGKKKRQKSLSTSDSV